MSKIFSIYKNNLIIYGSKTQPNQEAILSLIKNQLGVRRIVEDSSTSKVYLNKNGELVVKSVEYRLDVDLGTPLYSFGLLSDVHIDGDGTDTSYSISDLNNAIKFFNDEGCDFIAYCGDMSFDGRSEDFTALKSCLDASTIPNYTIRGNHDAYVTDNGYLEAIGKTEEDYTVLKGNDLFIFMSHNIGTELGAITDSQITWLTDLFNNNKDKRIFFFYHIPFRGTSGDGGGGIYPWALLGDSTTTQSIALRNLLENNSNVIFMHGHTHLRFSLGDIYPNANHYHVEGQWYDIHVPSCARPRIPDTSSADGVTSLHEGSEGYVVEVYTDKVVFKPRDFIAGEYLMQYAYIVPLGVPLYTFGLLSDAHVDGDGDDTAYSISDTNNAIKFFNDEGCEFIAYCGDMTNNGYESDFTALKACLDTSTIPNYTIRGNHDCRQGNIISSYKNATGREQDYTITKNDDLFIFLSLDHETDSSGNDLLGVDGGLTQAKVDWLTNIINNSNHRRIFLFYHCFFRNTCGDGGGGTYPYSTIGDSTLNSYAQDFINLVNNTPNLIFCSGHSHFRFNLQDQYPNANHYHVDNNCYYIHVPSASRPRGSSSETLYAESEGYLVEVYANKIVFKPRDFITGEYLTQYNYIVEL